MAELILELLSEEIPARMQRHAAEQLREKMMFRLKEEGLYHQKVRSYVTPRRLVLHADGLSLTQEEKTIEKRGPRVDAPEKALEGFLRSTGMRKEELVAKETSKGEFYFAITHEKGKPTKEILHEALEELIPSISWPKSMRWGDSDIRWVRPLNNIACLFGGEILPIQYGHLAANDRTIGHRFLGDEPFSIQKFDAYKKQLSDQHVMLSLEERIETIRTQATELAKSKSLHLVEDERLMEEVAGLVEWPTAYMGEIGAEFMVLPEEVLISSIRTHQKYICLRDKDGRLAPHFIVISNMVTDDKGASIIAGNERVLRARLSDALFFWEQDQKHGLDHFAKKLHQITFHARLGTLEDKVKRIQSLATFLAVWVPHAKLETVSRAAELSKADLSTEMVGEFPELQGTMGFYYASLAEEDELVARAIRNHYKPEGPQDRVPQSPITIAIALADKMDSLAGLFAVDEQPTGSKDPFALRRAALGIIRIILEHRLRVPLRILIDHSLKQYPRDLFVLEEEDEDKKGLLSKLKRKRLSPAKLSRELQDFFIERLKAQLKADHIRPDLIQAVFAVGEDDMLRLKLRAEALQAFVDTEDGQNLMAAYKRASNILRAEEAKEGKGFKPSPSSSHLQQPEEKKLYEALQSVDGPIQKALKEDDFAFVMGQLSTIRGAIDLFFDQVKVNADENDLRINRLKLLSQFRELCGLVADMEKIEGSSN